VDHGLSRGNGFGRGGVAVHECGDLKAHMACVQSFRRWQLGWEIGLL
jgi:hypothetical protein